MRRRRGPGVIRMRTGALPLGHRVFAKMSYVHNVGYPAVPPLPFIRISDFSVNGLSSPQKSALSDNRIANVLNQQFESYLVHGVKFSITAQLYNVNSTAEQVPPSTLVFYPYWLDGGTPTSAQLVNFGYMQQFPGVRMAALSNWGTGGRSTTLRGYIDVARSRGITKQDLRDEYYRGNIVDLTGNYADPLLKLYAGAYIVRTDGISEFAANVRTVWVIRTTYLVEFMNPSSVAIN